MSAMSPNTAFVMVGKDGAALVVVTDRDGKPSHLTSDEAGQLERAIHEARMEGEKLVAAVGIGVRSLADRAPDVAATEDREKSIKEANAKADEAAKKSEDEQRKEEQKRGEAVAAAQAEAKPARRGSHAA